jgi:hypothetical protein
MERGDAAAIRVAAPKLVRSGFLIIDNQVTLFRGRQAMMPPSRSTYQATGITIALYRTMSASANAWYEARVEGRPAEAAAGQRTRLLALAAEIDTLTRTGRAHLAAEMVELDADMRSHGGSAPARQLLERARNVMSKGEKFFAVGDELAAWARAHADTPGGVLAGQAQPELFLDLTAFEQRLAAVTAEIAAEMARTDN